MQAHMAEVMRVAGPESLALAAGIAAELPENQREPFYEAVLDRLAERASDADLASRISPVRDRGVPGFIPAEEIEF